MFTEISFDIIDLFLSYFFNFLTGKTKMRSKVISVSNIFLT